MTNRECPHGVPEDTCPECSRTEAKPAPTLNLVRNAGANFIEVCEWPSQRTLFSLNLPDEARIYSAPAFPQWVEKADAIVRACNSHAALVAERDALRDELDLTKAGLEFAKDAAFRLSGVAAEQYSKSDVEAICSIALAAAHRKHETRLAKAREFVRLRWRHLSDCPEVGSHANAVDLQRCNCWLKVALADLGDDAALKAAKP